MKFDSVFEQRDAWNDRSRVAKPIIDGLRDDDTIHSLSTADRVPDPTHVACQLTNGAIGRPRSLQLEDREVSGRIDREQVNRAYRGRVFDAITTGRIDIECEMTVAKPEAGEILREKIAELVFERECRLRQRAVVVIADLGRLVCHRA